MTLVYVPETENVNLPAIPEPLTEDPHVEKEVFEADVDERDRNNGNYIVHDLNDSFEFETNLTDQFGRVVLACRTENQYTIDVLPAEFVNDGCITLAESPAARDLHRG